MSIQVIPFSWQNGMSAPLFVKTSFRYFTLQTIKMLYQNLALVIGIVQLGGLSRLIQSVVMNRISGKVSL
jgi:hypothetical protein